MPIHWNSWIFSISDQLGVLSLYTDQGIIKQSEYVDVPHNGTPWALESSDILAYLKRMFPLFCYIMQAVTFHNFLGLD